VGADGGPPVLGSGAPRSPSAGIGTGEGEDLSVVEEHGSDEEAEASLSLSGAEGEAAFAARSAPPSPDPPSVAASSAGVVGLPDDPGAAHDISQRRWARRAGDAVSEVEASVLLAAIAPELTAENDCALLTAAIAREVLSELCRRAGVGRAAEGAQRATGGGDKAGSTGEGQEAGAPEAAAGVTAHDVAAAAAAWLPPLARAECSKWGRHAVSAFASVWTTPDRVVLRVKLLRGAPGRPAEAVGVKTVSLGPDEPLRPAVLRALRGMRVDPARQTLLFRGAELPTSVPNPRAEEEEASQSAQVALAASRGETGGFAPQLEAVRRALPPTAALLLLGEEGEVFAVDGGWWSHRRRDAARRGMLTSRRGQEKAVRALRTRAESKVRKLREWGEDGPPSPSKGGEGGAGSPPRSRVPRGAGKRIEGAGEAGDGQQQQRRGGRGYGQISSSGYGQGGGASGGGAGRRRERVEETKEAEAKEVDAGKRSPRPRRARTKAGGAGPGAELRAAKALSRSCNGAAAPLEAALGAVRDVHTRLREAAEACEAAGGEGHAEAGGGEIETAVSATAVSALGCDPDGGVDALLAKLELAKAAVEAALRVAHKVKTRGLLGSAQKP